MLLIELRNTVSRELFFKSITFLADVAVKLFPAGKRSAVSIQAVNRLAVF